MACIYKDVNGVHWIFEQTEHALDFLKAASEDVNSDPADYDAKSVEAVDGSASDDYGLRVSCTEGYNRLRQTGDVDQAKYPELPMPRRNPPQISRTEKGRFNRPTTPPRKGTGR